MTVATTTGIPPNPIVYAGQAILATWTLTDQNGALTNPSAMTVKYQDQGLQTVPIVLTLGLLTNPSVGKFTYVIDTTNLVPDIWNLQAQATGAILAVDFQTFQVLARPLG